MDESHSGQLCDKNKVGAEKGSGASQDAPAKEEEGKVAKALHHDQNRAQLWEMIPPAACVSR